MDRDYSDIINLPHHVSAKHHPMSLSDRAAQFSPFAALTGHGDAIDETGRYTDIKPDFYAEYMSELNEKLNILKAEQEKRKNVSVRYFVKDKIKSGGKYSEYKGEIKKINEFEKTLITENNITINFDDIMELNINEDN